MSSFDNIYWDLVGKMLSYGSAVDTGHWQSLSNVPQTKTWELLASDFVYPIPDSLAELQADVKPNLPWAEDHFAERVGGLPTNPGDTYMNWPYYKGNVEQHKEQGEFSHTYMERIWPRFANPDEHYHDRWPGHEGIRYRYGDLNDVLKLLNAEPYTRQAFLPIWFPEDTGAHAGERVPCTLGYHFMRRGNKMHVWYPIRSCDLLRHFRDDVYLASRLVQWVLGRLGWEDVVPGNLWMTMNSLHIFEPEVEMLRKQYKQVIESYSVTGRPPLSDEDFGAAV